MTVRTAVDRVTTACLQEDHTGRNVENSTGKRERRERMKGLTADYQSPRAALCVGSSLANRAVLNVRNSYIAYTATSMQWRSY